MKQRWRTPLALLSACTFAVLAVGGAAAVGRNGAGAQETLQFVALGDSYGSGTGAGDYFPRQADDIKECYRSRNSANALYAAARESKMTLDFEACSGNKTAEVIAQQGEPLTPDTDLVALSVGGNNIGCANIILQCRGIGDCGKANDESRVNIDSALPAAFTATLDFIRTESPAAKVLITGYPVPYDASTECAGGISKAKRTDINHTIVLLNAKLATLVDSRQDGKMHFYDPTSEPPNRLCGTNGVGTNGYFIFGPFVNPIQGMYHPTPEGHKLAYLPGYDWFGVAADDGDSDPDPSPTPTTTPTADPECSVTSCQSADAGWYVMTTKSTYDCIATTTVCDEAGFGLNGQDSEMTMRQTWHYCSLPSSSMTTSVEANSSYPGTTKTVFTFSDCAAGVPQQTKNWNNYGEYENSAGQFYGKSYSEVVNIEFMPGGPMNQWQQILDHHAI